MSIQITIIGLGQIGASLGLALTPHSKNILRVGHDKNMTVAQNAQKMGAVDEIRRNLPRSVRDADVVILSLPLSEIRETLGYIAQDLKPDAVILDTAPAKAIVQQWVAELLPVGHPYVGLAPVINPVYLHEEALGVESARADLFHKSVMLIAAPSSASEGALQLAADLAQLVGSQPLFADPAEADGLLATAHLLPQLTAAALLNATVESSGWGEVRKVAGRAYAETTRSILHQEGAASLTEAVFANRENLIYKLDEMLASIQALKESLVAEDRDALAQQLTHAEEGRLLWSYERKSAAWLMPEEGKKMSVELAGIAERIFGFKERKPRN